MAFNDALGYKVERFTADSAVNGGKPVRLYAMFAKGGAAKGQLEWHEAADAATPANKRGGLTAPTGDWASVTNMRQQLSKLFLDLDVNIAEAIVVYQPIE